MFQPGRSFKETQNLRLSQPLTVIYTHITIDFRTKNLIYTDETLFTNHLTFPPMNSFKAMTPALINHHNHTKHLISRTEPTFLQK